MIATHDDRSTPRLPKAEMSWEPSSEIDDPRSTPVPYGGMLSEAGIPHISALLKELVELWNGPEEDDYGIARPTKSAFDETVTLLVDTATVLGGRKQIPRGCVSVDSVGGVRVEWVRDQCNVHLAVPASDETESYIFHEFNGNYATEEATPEGLAEWLRRVE